MEPNTTPGDPVPSRARGFTLIELITVVALVGILAAIAVGKILAIGCMSCLKAASPRSLNPCISNNRPCSPVTFSSLRNHS